VGQGAERLARAYSFDCGAAACVTSALVIAALLIAAPARAEVERPPQFVVMAFDNCTELERWRDLTEFAAEMNKSGERLHFTFFVSGTNLIADASRMLYQGPRNRRGYSSINFGGSADDVAKRVEFINTLHRAGHEIASHAVGHFNGATWSIDEWRQELRAYSDVIDKVAAHNGLPEATRLIFDARRVQGFRAPYLAAGPGLYGALKASGFRYDASRVSPADAWPEKVDGLWRFNLAALKISGSRRATLSMDFNFFMAQSRARNEPSQQDRYGEQMLATYLDYFKASYTGNRAPLHIGHHFASMQGGVYHEALKTFARMVCGLSEVRCISYETLADVMDKLAPEALAAYRNGAFPRAELPILKMAGRR
jgi:hypothetical protein